MRLGAVLAFVLMLSACGGGAGGGDSALPPLPQKPGARMCASQCHEAQNYCNQTCDLDNRSCVNDAQAKAIHDYDSYAREHFLDGSPVTLRPSDFENMTGCNGEKASCATACDKAFRTCYNGCLGPPKPTPQSSCSFLCF